MASTLLVPVHLDVLHVTAPLAVVGPTLPYTHLPHHAEGRAVNPDVAYLLRPEEGRVNAAQSPRANL